MIRFTATAIRRSMRTLLKDRLVEMNAAVAPLFLVVVALQITLVGAPVLIFLQFVAGSTLVVLGMLLLFIGVDFGFLPMPRFIGAELPTKKSMTLIVAVAFALGFAVTVAEPDVPRRAPCCPGVALALMNKRKSSEF